MVPLSQQVTFHYILKVTLQNSRVAFCLGDNLASVDYFLRLLLPKILSDICGCKASDYSDNALETVINMSTIVHNEDSVHNIISSPAEEIKFCEVNSSDNSIEKRVYPGQHFDVPLIAFGQAGYPVPTTVFWEIKNYNKNFEYCLSPLSQTTESLCTKFKCFLSIAFNWFY